MDASDLTTHLREVMQPVEAAAREAAKVDGVPVNLIADRAIEIIPNPGETPVIVPELHRGKIRGRLTGGTFRRKPLTEVESKS